jgi:hypothetical protein
MGFSRIKEFLSRKTVRAIVFRRNGTGFGKSVKYGKYGETIIADKGYYVDANYIIKINRHNYIFYDEDNPFPLPIIQALAQGYFKAEMKSGTFAEALRTKFLDEVTRAPSQVMLVLILAGVNVLLSLVIIAKLWGVFEPK